MPLDGFARRSCLRQEGGAPLDATANRRGASVRFRNRHGFLGAVMRRGKPAQQFGTKAIGGFIATLPLRHVQTERRGGHRRSYSFEAGRDEKGSCPAEDRKSPRLNSQH